MSKFLSAGEVQFGKTPDGELALVVCGERGPVVTALPPMEALKLAQTILTALTARAQEQETKEDAPALPPPEKRWDLIEIGDHLAS